MLLNDSYSRAIYIDGAFSSAVRVMPALAAVGITPAAILFTHRHFIGLADDWNGAVENLAGAPMLLHPIDAEHPQASKWSSDVTYENPIEHPLLEPFGLTCTHFPGHTAGSIFIEHTPTGILFVGDCAMTHNHTEPPRASRPPAPFSADDEGLQVSWAAFLDAGVLPKVLAPYHGLPVSDPSMDLLLPLRATEKTVAPELVKYQLEADLKDGKTYIKTDPPETEWTLYYHGLKNKGRAEYIRLIFEVAGVKFKEINNESFQIGDAFTLRISGTYGKAEYPSFAVPYVKGPHGFYQSQTTSIAARLGKLFGLYPNSEDDQWHALQIALSVADFAADARQPFHPKDHNASYYGQEAEAAIAVPIFEGSRFVFWMRHFEHLLQANISNSGYFVGTKLSYCDILVFHALCGAEAQFPTAWVAVAEHVPLLRVFKERIEALPQIVEYFASSRRNPWEGNSML